VLADAREPDWSPDGRSLVYADLRTRTISLASASGDQARAITQHEPGIRYSRQRRPAFSHDGRRVAFERRIGGPYMDLGVVDLGTGRQLALTGEQRMAACPVWSPDDRWIYHASSRGGTVNVWKIPSLGGPPLQVTVGQGDDTEPSLSPDGKRMAFATHRAKFGIGEIPLDTQGVGDPPIRWLTSDTANGAQGPAYSPDGERIAFFSLRPGGDSDSSVWVVGRDGKSATSVLRDDYRNIFPRWSRDGQSLVFHTWSVEVDPGIRRVNLAGGPPEVINSDLLLILVDVDPRGRLIGSGFDPHPYLYDPATRKTVAVEAIDGGGLFRWSPDGERVAFIQPPGTEKPGAWVYDFKNPPQRVFEGWVAGIAWTAADALYVAKPRSDLRASVWRVNPATLARERLRPLLSVGYNYWDQEMSVWFDVSPDGRRLATQAMEQWEADIGMIEGLR
jgi:Tol biopolymer transport system component